MSSRVKFLISLLAFSVVARVLPYFLTKYNIKVDSSVIFYPWNFMPLTAACLYAGAYFSDRRLSFGLPLIAVLISDLAIWLVSGDFAWAFPSDRWSAYVSYPIMIAMGTGLSQRAWPARAADALLRGIAAEALFFVVTNFAYFQIQTDLPHTMTGLGLCYARAIPFVSKAFASTAFYSILLFSPLAIRAAGGTTMASESLATSAVPVAE